MDGWDVRHGPSITGDIAALFALIALTGAAVALGVSALVRKLWR